ncbi:HAMP domain-containing sensor histidine kinase [Pseudomonas sp. MDMC216]|nr:MULTISPECIES: HAMP domain-containing sensor histidine kinase [Pseudomonas]MDI5995479.1 HAMP domain-containing sensor histidine kinase [Pseudomonas sp. MDMC216]MDI6010096.1 HAMP domain-containing sensor histidine kinase [Pseudomonas sp. MDMC17]MDP3366431.1 HAMP domain-containing sensor histidine kinase [Pseudomonas sp.]MDZ4192817.1 HAMP domain-containing sensor histidine kinase [Pseudomonas sp.]RAR37142.1 sensor histidine kinase [Pseudomonas sp. MDMC224]
MLSKQPFERRILIAFVLMTVMVSGLFSLSIVGVVHFIEEHLVSQEMSRELGETLNEDIRQGRPPRLDSSTQFFSSYHDQYLIPQQYAGLQEGFNEVVSGDEALYIYVQKINGETYMLVQEQQEFEARENALFNVVLAGFLITVVAAWGLGLMMARKVMAPVSRLAQQVRHRDQLHPLAPPLAPDYPDDEIGQLAAAFDSTLGQVRQSLERERLFTSDVSHELRTPLMVIATSCELLAEAPLGPREKEQVARIARASEEMRELVQTFLQLARDKSNEAAFGGDRTLAGIAHEQASRWSVLMKEKGLDFQLTEEGQDDGRYNATFLGTVMANLLRNALHYTERGSVRLILEQGAFRIEDSGAGIPAEQHERIFQPFVRGLQARGEGLGLGLSLVKRICAKQGWQVSLQSEPGHTRFRVTLNGDA